MYTQEKRITNSLQKYNCKTSQLNFEVLFTFLKFTIYNMSRVLRRIYNVELSNKWYLARKLNFNFMNIIMSLCYIIKLLHACVLFCVFFMNLNEFDKQCYRVHYVINFASDLH